MSEEPIKSHWFQFTTRDMFLGVTLFAIGFGGIMVAGKATQLPGGEFSVFVFIQAYMDSCACIGAGLLSPFRRKMLGALIGFSIAAPIYLLHRFLLHGSL